MFPKTTPNDPKTVHFFKLKNTKTIQNSSINSKNYGKYLGNLSKLDKFISLTSQKLINQTDEKVKNLDFDAYDCMLFLKDPSIRPDSLLNISKHLDRTSKITNTIYRIFYSYSCYWPKTSSNTDSSSSRQRRSSQYVSNKNLHL